MTPSSPFSLFLDLGGVPEHGVEHTLSPNAEERHEIARWLGVEAVESLTAAVRLKRRGEDHYVYEARFETDLVQACVVTLDPVPAHLTGEFRRDFRIRPKTQAKKRRQAEAASAPVELTGLEDDEAEWLDQPLVDLAAPVLEELTLALDPYPRAAGAAFEVPAEETPARDNPFAVLEALKVDQKEAGVPPKTAQRPKKGK